MLAQLVGHRWSPCPSGSGSARRGGPGRGGAAFRRRRAVEHPVTTPPMPGRDSLVLAGTIELLGGGVPSTHPSCPGAIFRLRRATTRAPPAVRRRGHQDPDRRQPPHGRWADNRTVKLPVIIFAADRPTLIAARELLAQLLDVDQFETRWHRDGAPGPMVLDCFRAGAAGPGYSVLEERRTSPGLRSRSRRCRTAGLTCGRPCGSRPRWSAGCPPRCTTRGSRSMTTPPSGTGAFRCIQRYSRLAGAGGPAGRQRRVREQRALESPGRREHPGLPPGAAAQRGRAAHPGRGRGHHRQAADQLVGRAR